VKVHPAAWSLFLLLAVGIAAAGFYAAQPRTDVAPPYRATTTHGTSFDLEAERGKILVLDFFNIYCESCAILEKDLSALQPQWNESDVRIVSIGVEPANSIEDLSTYEAKHNLTWTVVSDTDGALEKFGVVALPTLAVVDRDGTIVFHAGGLPGRATMTRVVEQAVAGTATTDPYTNYPLWALAMVAAVASFFSPCAIGLLPGYVAHTVRFHGGRSARRVAGLGGLAALGLLLVFLGIGGLAFAFGRAVSPFVPWLAPLIGLVFVAVGLLLLFRPYSLFLQRVFSPLTQVSEGGRGGVSYFLYGLGYGAGAAGCTAPVLLSLVALAGGTNAATALLTLVLYAVTAAALMAILTVVVASGREGLGRWIVRHAHKVEVVSALIFVGAGVFLLWFAMRAGTLAV